MPRIILTAPFLHHYEGSVFQLSDKIDYFDWDEEEWIRERKNYDFKRFYHLPDDGRGKPVGLPLHYTQLCPESIFEEIEIFPGPCRITSVSEELQLKDDPYYSGLYPEGRGRIILKDKGNFKKNVLTFNSDGIKMFDELEFTNMVTETKYNLQNASSISIDVSKFPPGFYRAKILIRGKITHRFTMLKCFPLAVHYNRKNNSYTTEKTIW